jgi:xanthine dehydrogenase accessory factor
MMLRGLYIPRMTERTTSSSALPARLDAVDAARAVLEARNRGVSIAVVTVVSPEAMAGARLIVEQDGAVSGTLGEAELEAIARDLAAEALAGAEPHSRTVQVSAGERTLYVEAHRATERLLVVGAGHIAVPLAQLGLELGFDVTVLDDREEFATQERFAGGVHVLRADFEADPFAGAVIDGSSYVALVTRGHRWDFDCLRRLLALPTRPRYLGMIGSRRRVRAAFGALLAAGIPREELARIHAPIGLEIRAESPAEIAVSIAAEMVAVRRGADVESLSRKERVLERLLPVRGDDHG